MEPRRWWGLASVRAAARRPQGRPRRGPSGSSTPRRPPGDRTAPERCGLCPACRGPMEVAADYSVVVEPRADDRSPGGIQRPWPRTRGEATQARVESRPRPIAQRARGAPAVAGVATAINLVGPQGQGGASGHDVVRTGSRSRGGGGCWQQRRKRQRRRQRRVHPHRRFWSARSLWARPVARLLLTVPSIPVPSCVSATADATNYADAATLAVFGESIAHWSGAGDYAIDGFSNDWYTTAGGAGYTFGNTKVSTGGALARDDPLGSGLPTWNTVNCSQVYGRVFGQCTDLTAAQWSPPYVSAADAAAAGTVQSCAAWGAPEISYTLDQLVPDATYTVSATVAGINYYGDVYTDALCTENAAVTVVVECTGGTAVFLTAESAADQTKTAVLGNCVAGSSGSMTVTVNHWFQFYEEAIGGTTTVYVPYGNPINSTTQATEYCNYNTGTLNRYTPNLSPPYDGTLEELSDPCTFFTPPTQGGIWVSTVAATTADEDCLGAVVTDAAVRETVVSSSTDAGSPTIPDTTTTTAVACSAGEVDLVTGTGLAPLCFSGLQTTIEPDFAVYSSVFTTMFFGRDGRRLVL